ncbi:MAG: hypothetical protein IKF52_03380 [Clostridia bacterium]|nr:hypothetical protein [Clostridia bacterium]
MEEEKKTEDVKKKKRIKLYVIIIIFMVIIIALIGVQIYSTSNGYGGIVGLLKGEKKEENTEKQNENKTENTEVGDFFVLYNGYEIKKTAGVQNLSEMKITDEATKKYNKKVYYNYQNGQYAGETTGTFGEQIYEGVSVVDNVSRIAISEKYDAIPRKFTATDKLPNELKDMADYTHVEIQSIDLDGDGTDERIVGYHLNYKAGEIGDGSPEASSGIILMDSNYKKIADLVTLEDGFWGGIKEEAQKIFIEIRDTEYVDIDNDGVMEIIIDVPTYEGKQISIIKYDNGKVEGQTDIKASVDNGKVNSATTNQNTNNTEKDIAFSTGKYVIQGANLSPDPENYGIESLELEYDNEFSAKMPLGTSYVGLYSVEDNKIKCIITGVRENEGGNSLGNASGELVFEIKDKENIVLLSTTNTTFNLTVGKTYKLENKDFSKYIGTWQDDEEGTNTLVIKSVNNNKITFELGIFRTVVYENLIATIDSNNKVTFNTNGTEQGEFWEGVYGNLEFEDNKITVKITKSECDYIQPGFEIVFSIKK